MSVNNNYRRGDQHQEKYYLELLRRAIAQRDQHARQRLQNRFRAPVQSWLKHHPRRAEASRLDSDENYVAEAFKRLWQENVHDQKLDFPTLDAALTYLRAYLNSAVLDKLRDYSRPKDTETGTFRGTAGDHKGPPQGAINRAPTPPSPLREEFFIRKDEEPTGTSNPEEQPIADQSQNHELWESIQATLSTARERRLAYLLFHCGLKPSEIMFFCSQEFSDIQEIYQLRSSIFDELQESVFQIH